MADSGMSYQDILGAVVLTALALLVVAVVCFLIAVMVRAYRMGGTKAATKGSAAPKVPVLPSPPPPPPASQRRGMDRTT